MDIEYLIDCIENEIESSNFDFKKDIYDFKVPKSKQDLLIDVISLANSHAKGDKYIITGVKLYPDGNRDLDGITESKIKDGADYQSLINDNVEPNVIVDFSIIDYSGNKYGVFKIGKENSDPPYLLSKKYGDMEKGFIKIRKGQKNEFISRRDLDLYYSKKINNELSEIKLKGIIKNKVHEQFQMNNYTCDIDFQLLRNKIYDLFVEMYNYKLEESCINNLSLGNPIKFEDEDIKNIKYYSENNDMIITKDFFNIGNLKCCKLHGMSTSFSGSESEKKKYELICKLEKLTGIYNGLKLFYDKLIEIGYCELLIENIGKKHDEDIEVILKLKKEYFFDFNNLPIPNESIIEKMLDNQKLYEILENKRIHNVNRYTGISDSIMPIEPSSYSVPGMLGSFGPSYETYCNYYKECIDYIANYEITSDEEYYFIKYEQKNIRPNEKIFLPSRLLFKNIPEFIEYEIKSKFNSNIQKGIIKCANNS